MVHRVPNVWDQSVNRVGQLFGQNIGVHAGGDGNILGAMDDFDWHFQLWVAQGLLFDVGQQGVNLTPVRAQCRFAQGQPRADIIEISFGGRLGCKD